MKSIVERAACRVDFSGGTVDLWPLYLYLGGLELVHMAIQVKAEAKITWKPTRKKSHVIQVSSLDLNRSESYSSLDALRASLSLTTAANPLRWVNRVVAQKLGQSASAGHWTIETQSAAPPGSGLGGSSTLGIALGRGLEKILRPPSKRSLVWDLQRETRDLEAVEIEHPAGDQDYVPALFGGLLIFHLGAHVRKVEKLPAALAKFLGERCAILYTGKPHHSGINNWQIFMDYHNQKTETREALRSIRNLSGDFANALRKNRRSEFADLLNEEWRLRQRLSPAVCAPVLDDAWAHGKSLGAVARKACGAGGGGSLLLYFSDALSKAKALETPLPRADWKWLDARPA